MNVKNYFLVSLLTLGLIGMPNAMQAARSEAVAPSQQEKDTRTVTGTVVDSYNGEAIIGAYVQEKDNPNNVVTTDVDGTFAINVSKKKAGIEVSYVGYKTASFDVTGMTDIQIKLESDNALEEVVVVGAGTQKKVSITGAITSVDGEQLRMPTSSLTAGLAGKLAGVIQTNSSGAPGSTSDFYIRGIGTFGGRATPLILLDDVEISAGDLNRIPPETIKTFTVLKDASATAIYGVRGSNGVMIVTTKTGSQNTKAKIGVTIENSFVSPMNMPKFVDGATWMELYNEAALARGAAAGKYSQEIIDYTRSGINPLVFPSVDWQDVMFRDMNVNQRANINIQGGGNRVSYYMSLQFNHDTGIVNAPKDYMYNNNIQNYDYVFQNNISYQLTNSTTVDLHMNAQIFQRNGVYEDVNSLFSYVNQTNPVMFPAYFPAQEGDNHIRFGNAILTDVRRRTNPYAAMMDDHAQSKYNTLNTSLKINQKFDFITKGLELTALVNFKNYSSTSFIQRLDPYYYRIVDGTWDPENPEAYQIEMLGDPGKDYVTEEWVNPGTDNTFYFDARLNYNRTFGKHTVGGLLMLMMRSYQPAQALPQRNQGLSGRFTYDFDQRYWLEFNFGYNGTERLPKGDRFEFFPAVSVGWVPSSEKFWEPMKKVVDYLKLRGSYGLVGSDGFGGNHFVYFDSITCLLYTSDAADDLTDV